jgi:elongation factor G
VAYRETISKTAELDYTHKKQTGDSGQFARIKLRIEPLQPGAGRAFENEIVGGNVPREFIPPVENGVMAVADSGVLAGFPLRDFRVSLYDGAYHDIDSSAMAFEIAARAAMRELVQHAGPKLLEPIMAVEVVAPEEFSARIASDLRRRRGETTAAESRAGMATIRGEAPLANLFGYAGDIFLMTTGRGKAVLQFARYAAVPDFIVDPDPPGGASMRLA